MRCVNGTLIFRGLCTKDRHNNSPDVNAVYVLSVDLLFCDLQAVADWLIVSQVGSCTMHGQSSSLVYVCPRGQDGDRATMTLVAIVKARQGST